MKLYQRFLVALLFGVFFLGTYKGVQILAQYSFIEPITLTLPDEEKIPFMPVTFILYMLVYFLPPAAFFVAEKKGHVFKICVAFLMASVVHYLIFILIPVEYELRPPLEVGTLSGLIAFIYEMDAPLNCFPSMHVSFAFLSYYCVKRFRPEWAPVVLVLAIATSVSTVFVKQHYILDVLSALPIAWGINYFFISRGFGKAAKVWSADH